MLVGQANADPVLASAGVGVLAEQVGSFLTGKAGRANTHLAHQEIDKQGCITISITGERLEATLWSIEESQCAQRFEGDDAALDALFQRTTFRVDAGDKTLYKDVDGSWLRWDAETMEWS